MMSRGRVRGAFGGDRGARRRRLRRMERGMFLPGGSRGGRRRTGCRGLSRTRTSCMRVWHGSHRERFQTLSTWTRRSLKCSEPFVSNGGLFKKKVFVPTLKFFASSLLSITLAILSIALMPMIPLSARLVCSSKGPAKSSVETTIC